MKNLIILFVTIIGFQVSFAQENMEVNVEYLLGNKYQEDVKQYIESERGYMRYCKEYYNKNIMLPMVIGNYFSSSSLPYKTILNNDFLSEELGDIIHLLKRFEPSVGSNYCSTELYEFTKTRFNIYEEAFKYYYLLDKNETAHLEAKQIHDKKEQAKIDAIINQRKEENNRQISDFQNKKDGISASSRKNIDEILKEREILEEKKRTIKQENNQKQESEIKKLPMANFAQNKNKIIQKYTKINKDALASIDFQIKSLNERQEKEQYLLDNNTEIAEINDKIKSLEETDFMENLPLKEKFDDSEFLKRQKEIENSHKESLKQDALKLNLFKLF